MTANYLERMNYKGKIILSNIEDDRGYEVIILATNKGGYSGVYSVSREELINNIRVLLEEKGYTLSDVQNSPRDIDGEVCSHYLDCFPKLEDKAFDSILEELKQ